MRQIFVQGNYFLSIEDRMGLNVGKFLLQIDP